MWTVLTHTKNANLKAYFEQIQDFRIKTKRQKQKIIIIAKEEKTLWKKLNLPIQQGKSSESKIRNAIEKLESMVEDLEVFTSLLNVTN